MENTRHLSFAVRAASGLMLIIALGEQPYSYYQILRIVICGASIFLVWYFIQVKLEWLGWLFIVPAILFNPVLPIYLEKSTWQLLDLIFGIMFLGSLTTYKKENLVN
jgi:hypothetical protein